MEAFDLFNLDLDQPVTTLARWYDDLNGWRWPHDLQPAPEGYTDDQAGWEKWPRERRQRHIRPIMRAIAARVPHQERLRYAHIHRLGRTDAEFEKWWAENQDFADIIETVVHPNKN